MSVFVSVKNLVKNYGDFCAVDNLSFSVEKGEIFGLLGPNGAGKSTTINVITTLDGCTKGTVEIGGMDIEKHRTEVKRLIGVVPQDIAVYPFLSAIENVRFFASLYGIKGKQLEEAAKEALEFTGLADKAGMKPKHMSGGMKRRLNIACGIAHSPKLIIMDEPTVGVDAQSREHILDFIKILRDRGATVIYTSHYMNEVEQLCDRIAIIDRGRLVACGTGQELVSLVTEYKSFKLKTKIPADFDEKQFIKNTVSLPTVHAVAVNGDVITIETTLECSDFSDILEHIRKFRLPVISVVSQIPDLDSVFLTLTGHEMR
ncbi:ABC transporter ATP-binding protein [Ruminococcus sp. Marseille-P6503]|uniref:ABC transporter ATP-binding protein n=1 Tax=Ruminococcus sp. Marseille-P6503 TaxID=2364796 RepID=UPI000F52AFE1|nr:ABC transporter ATP-binding protein [Ruminococcus sp. Marseille-P6503]